MKRAISLYKHILAYAYKLDHWPRLKKLLRIAGMTASTNTKLNACDASIEFSAQAVG